MKRTTKKEGQQLEAQKAAVGEQLESWITAKSEVSLIFFGPFFEYGMEGYLEHAPDRPEILHFFGSQTSFRASISLDRCVAVKAPGRDGRAIMMLLQGATGPRLLLCDPKRPVPDVAKLLKLSGGQPKSSKNTATQVCV